MFYGHNQGTDQKIFQPKTGERALTMLILVDIFLYHLVIKKGFLDVVISFFHCFSSLLLLFNMIDFMERTNTIQ